MEQGIATWGTPFELLKSHGPGVASALLIAVVGWIAAAWTARSVRSFGKRWTHIDVTLVPVLASVSRLTVLTVTAMAVLERFGVDTKSLFAVLGAAGLTIGLALKDTLSDVAAGLVLLVLRPFDVGDAIEVDGTSGIVDAIDVFQTKLTSFDGVPITLPNSKVRSAKIQNFTRAQRRRMDLTVGVSATADIAHAIATLRDVLASEPRVLPEPAPAVDVIEIADEKVNLLVRAWTLPADFFPARLELTRHLKERLDAEGIVVPMPQRELHIPLREPERRSAPLL
ncbi:mechanosensitive ion channel family protein [Sorangium sp. So ce1078]|uniref:mechanosensitive ion channel family protein n=1 Tax=Sorangium sp. So ce1078 TaxID=3133329 RepID=UPI003F5E3E46